MQKAPKVVKANAESTHNMIPLKFEMPLAGKALKGVADVAREGG